MGNKLSKGVQVNTDEERKLGVMRIDWYDGKLCNQWNPNDFLFDLYKRQEIDLKTLQQELNYIQFELLGSFNHVESLCGGIGYEKETLFSISLNMAEYIIKLIPSKGAYSYIYTFLK